LAAQRFDIQVKKTLINFIFVTVAQA